MVENSWKYLQKYLCLYSCRPAQLCQISGWKWPCFSCYFTSTQSWRFPTTPMFFTPWTPQPTMTLSWRREVSREQAEPSTWPAPRCLEWSRKVLKSPRESSEFPNSCCVSTAGAGFCCESAELFASAWTLQRRLQGIGRTAAKLSPWEAICMFTVIPGSPYPLSASAFVSNVRCGSQDWSPIGRRSAVPWTTVPECHCPLSHDGAAIWLITRQEESARVRQNVTRFTVSALYYHGGAQAD